MAPETIREQITGIGSTVVGLLKETLRTPGGGGE
jgi:hypothetical protein